MDKSPPADDHDGVEKNLAVQFEYMALAVYVAFRALKNGETPVACIYVQESTGEILSWGSNDTNRSLNGTRHAEFVAVDWILEKKNLLGKPLDDIHKFFQGVTLYVTIEPCVMCASALKQLGLTKVVFGAANERFGGNGTVIKIQAEDTYQSYGGLMRIEAIHLLREFYIQENDTAPVPKVKKNKDIIGKGFPPNLNFPSYLSKDHFAEFYGLERLRKFYHDPGIEQEITPEIQSGYSFLDLISEEKVQAIPNLPGLYPDNCIDILGDLQTMSGIFPSVAENGSIYFRIWSPESKKRKFENDQVENVNG